MLSVVTIVQLNSGDNGNKYYSDSFQSPFMRLCSLAVLANSID